jgi:hypothetical protein
MVIVDTLRPVRPPAVGGYSATVCRAIAVCGLTPPARSRSTHRAAPPSGPRRPGPYGAGTLPSASPSGHRARKVWSLPVGGPQPPPRPTASRWPTPRAGGAGSAGRPRSPGPREGPRGQNPMALGPAGGRGLRRRPRPPRGEPTRPGNPWLRPRVRWPPARGQAAGSMFWFIRNRLVGSYFAFSFASRP